MGRKKITTSENDNYTWKKVKNEVNTARNKNKIELYATWDIDKLQCINVLNRLGYINPIVVTDGSKDYVQNGYYKIIKKVPYNLLWRVILR